MTIALDLEGTLISNAVSQFPRPGLYSFLEYCQRNFARIVIYTAVPEIYFRKIAKTLIDLKQVPDWFVNLEYIKWHGKYKNLTFIPNIKLDRVIIIDDRAAYIKPEQKKNWISIREYSYPYSQSDRELTRIVGELSKIDLTQ